MRRAPVGHRSAEFRLLNVLVRAAGSVVTHGQLLRDVGAPTHLEELRYLRVYLHHLRDKLEPIPAQPCYVLTEPGIGYRLQFDVRG